MREREASVSRNGKWMMETVLAAQDSKDDKGAKRVAGSGDRAVRAVRRGGLRLDEPERRQE